MKSHSLLFFKKKNLIGYFRNGELVLVDAGAEYYGYCSDITRTWPINGRFSKEQGKLYEIVLEAQVQCIEVFLICIIFQLVFK